VEALMGFLSRLALRARPMAARTPVLMPKGMAMRQPVPLYRETEPQEEEGPAQALRRTLRRVVAAKPDDEEMPRAPAPAAEPPSQEDEPEAMALRQFEHMRRAAEPKEEEDELAQTVRRAAQPEQEKGDEDMAQAARAIRRAEEVPIEEGDKPLRQPFQQDLSPGAAPLPPEMANEEEPPAMQALRRDVAVFAPTASPAPPNDGAETPAAAAGDAYAHTRPAIAGESWMNLPFGSPHLPGDGGNFHELPGRAGDGASGDAPTVTIDQVDVIIHEPPPAPASARPAFDQSRAMRARYLRRL
jgi:hypothetical protein